jgi:hypothetical protein
LKSTDLRIPLRNTAEAAAVASVYRFEDRYASGSSSVVVMLCASRAFGWLAGIGCIDAVA